MSTTIRVSKDTWKLIKDLKKGGETFDSVLLKLLQTARDVREKAQKFSEEDKLLIFGKEESI